MPASRSIRGRQPSAVSLETSRSLCGVPSGLEASNTNRPVKPTISAISRARSVMVTSVPVPMLIGSLSDQVCIRKTTASPRSSTLEELATGAVTAPDLHRISAVSNSDIDFGEQGWQDVAGGQVEIVVGAIKVGRHHRHEIATVLPAIGLAHFHTGDLGDGISGRIVENEIQTEMGEENNDTSQDYIGVSLPFLLQLNITRFGTLTLVGIGIGILVPLYRFSARLSTFYRAQADALRFRQTVEKRVSFVRLASALTPRLDFGKSQVAVDHGLMELGRHMSEQEKADRDDREQEG